MKEELHQLLRTASRLLDLRVIFKDFYQQSGLSTDDQWHLDQACIRHNNKDNGNRDCSAFCSTHLVRELADKEKGQIHRCPFKHTELAVPVFSNALFVGILYAGPIWQSSAKAPYPGLYPARKKTLLEDQLVMLRTFAKEIGHIIQVHHQDPGDRRQRIYQFIIKNMSQPISVQDIARHLSLSHSRCGHIVRELFNLTTPELIRQVKLQHAAHLLEGSSSHINEIARQCGFTDNNYFSRIFKARFDCSPSVYRESKQQTV